MARGFESKSVQSQWQDAEAKAEAKQRTPKSREEIELEKKREGLQLSRAHIEHELETTKSERRYAMLEEALKHLDRELDKLG